MEADKQSCEGAVVAAMTTFAAGQAPQKQCQKSKKMVVTENSERRNQPTGAGPTSQQENNGNDSIYSDNKERKGTIMEGQGARIELLKLEAVCQV